MKYLAALVLLFSGSLFAQEFTCPAGQADVMKYFLLSQERRVNQIMNGSPNPLYTTVFPDEDFAESGYWFWLKSSTANGFDVNTSTRTTYSCVPQNWSGRTTRL
jgi:hypothetical protein